MVTIACALWTDPARDKRGYRYTPDHVRTLKSMVARRLSLPHRFVCITDETIEGVETVPLDWRTHVPGTCYLKLMLWRPDIGKILGDRIGFLDLDCVVTDSLDPLFDRTEDVVLWRNPGFGQPRRSFYQTSIMLLTAGSRPGLWEGFDRDNLAHRTAGSDQALLSERLSLDEAHWTAADGVYHARYLGPDLPDNARAVFFPGSGEPSQPAMQERFPWIFDHYR